MFEDFTITSDPKRRLLSVRMRGLWTLATVASYHAEMTRAVVDLSRLGVRLVDLNLIIDARDFAAQPQCVVNAYQEIFHKPELTVRKVAVIATNSIFRLQARRIGAADQRVCYDAGEAMAWLKG